MKGFKGTSGKWIAHEDATGVSVFTEMDLICRTENKPTKNEAKANANLITVAPELGERLQESTDMLEALLSLFGDSMLESTKFEISKQIKENESEINKALGL